MSKIKITLHLQESNRYIDIIGDGYLDCYKLLTDFSNDSFRIIECNDVSDLNFRGVYVSGYKLLTHLDDELKREALSTLSEFKEGIPAMNLVDSRTHLEISPNQNSKS